MKPPWYEVRKRTLLAIAGCVWLAAGVNVARLGVVAYLGLPQVGAVQILLSLGVLAAFGTMFLRMSRKHGRRIAQYPEPTRPFWHFFDARSYLIMACMMTFGFGLRFSGLVPEGFIAVFYTGLGTALALAGVAFWGMFAMYHEA